MDDSRLDGLIDDVARQLTEAAPDVRLRGAVLDRLHSHRRPRWWMWILWPAVVAAVVSIVVFTGREDDRSPIQVPRQTDSRWSDVALVNPFASGKGEAPGTVHPSIQHLAPSTQHPRSVAQQRNELPPIEVPRVAVARLELSAIEPAPSIESEPLEPIAPLAIAPLEELKGERP